MSNPADRINDLVACENVRAVLAHWDYKNKCVEEYAGIKWIFDQWKLLREKTTNEEFMTKVNSEWKICILSFEPRTYFKSRDEVEMLLDLKTVKYVQTPPGKLQDIKSSISEISKAPNIPGKEQLNLLGKVLDKIIFPMQLKEHLHNFSRGDHDDDSLDKFREYTKVPPKTLDEDVRGALLEFRDTLNRPESDDFKEKCRALQQKIYGEWS